MPSHCGGYTGAQTYIAPTDTEPPRDQSTLVHSDPQERADTLTDAQRRVILLSSRQGRNSSDIHWRVDRPRLMEGQTQPSPRPPDGFGDPSLDPRPYSFPAPSSQAHTHIHTVVRVSTSPPAPPAPFSRPLPPAEILEGLTLPNQTQSGHCRAGAAATAAAQTQRLRVGGRGGGGGSRRGWAAFSPPAPHAQGSLSLLEGGEGSGGETMTTRLQ